MLPRKKFDLLVRSFIDTYNIELSEDIGYGFRNQIYSIYFTSLTVFYRSNIANGKDQVVFLHSLGIRDPYDVYRFIWPTDRYKFEKIMLKFHDKVDSEENIIEDIMAIIINPLDISIRYGLR